MNVTIGKANVNADPQDTNKYMIIAQEIGDRRGEGTRLNNLGYFQK